MPDGPADPFTQLTEGAAQFHEQFTSYVEAGFTRAEAMQIMLAMLTATITATINLQRPPQ